MRRVSFDVPEELLNEINNVIPWGIRKRLLTSLLEQVVVVGREYGEVGLAAIISNKITLKTAMEVMLDGYARRSSAVAPGPTTRSRDVPSPSGPSKSEDTKEGKGTDGVGGTDTETLC